MQIVEGRLCCGSGIIVPEHGALAELRTMQTCAA